MTLFAAKYALERLAPDLALLEHDVVPLLTVDLVLDRETLQNLEKRLFRQLEDQTPLRANVFDLPQLLRIEELQIVQKPVTFLHPNLLPLQPDLDLPLEKVAELITDLDLLATLENLLLHSKLGQALFRKLPEYRLLTPQRSPVDFSENLVAHHRGKTVEVPLGVLRGLGVPALVLERVENFFCQLLGNPVRLQILLNLLGSLPKSSLPLPELVYQAPYRIYIVAHHNSADECIKNDKDFLPRGHWSYVTVTDRRESDY